MEQDLENTRLASCPAVVITVYSTVLSDEILSTGATSIQTPLPVKRILPVGHWHQGQITGKQYRVLEK